MNVSLQSRQVKQRLLAGAVLATLVTGTVIARPSDGTDPLFRYQWHLQNLGQKVFGDTRPVAGVDLNVDELHRTGIRGKGILIAVVDDGLEINHEDLSANVRQGASKNFYDGSNDPTPHNAKDEHGTSVAGIAAAVGWNGKGGRGVAPEAQIAAFNFLTTDGGEEIREQQDSNIVYSWGGGAGAKDAQVFNNSWGARLQSYPAISTAELNSWEKLTNSTRNGRGGIYVKAAGNQFDNFPLATKVRTYDICAQETKDRRVPCNSANTDTYNNFISVITVGAVNASGVRSSYSSSGSALWVTGIGGEYGYQAAYRPGLIEKAYEPAIVTTDLTGCRAGGNADHPNVSADNALDTSKSNIDASCNYWAKMNGTSAATPEVSGIAALLLQVNPNLTSRDVKYILAITARKIDPDYAPATYRGHVIDPAWTTNKAGHPFSNWYGFGLADANAAVSKAKDFASLPPLRDSGWLSSKGGPQLIGANGNAATLTVNVPQDAKIEAVQLSFATTHKTPKNLRATLTSPSGTESTVLTPFATLADITSGTGFVVPLTSSNAFLDERAGGTWTLKVTDEATGRSVAQLKNFKLRVVGH